MTGTKHIIVLLTALISLESIAQIWLTHKPVAPLKESVDNQTVVNFDLVVENTIGNTLELTKVSVKMFDHNSKLLKEKFLDNNGTAPSIKVLNQRELKGNSIINLFNPFPVVPAVAKKLTYVLTFNDSITAEHSVSLSDYQQSMSFIMPVKTLTMVYDGHDLNSHHRRFDYEFEPIKNFGFTSNFMRYAYDFIQIDTQGKMFANKGENNSDWFGFGSEVVAVADGTIVAADFSKPDDKSVDFSKLKDNHMELFGNYVVIKHNDGLFSVYGHLMQQSSKLKIGDKVIQGQQIGKVGTSGSSFMPHLHFEVRDSSKSNPEGLPSYFDNFSIMMGETKIKIKRGTVNTGDIFMPGK